MTEPFFLLPVRTLKSPDTELTNWIRELEARAGEKKLDDLVDFLKKDSQQSAFLNAALALSQFLRETFLANPEFLLPLLVTSIEQRLKEILASISETIAQNETILMDQLRLKKLEAHSLIALGDLAGISDVPTTTLWLSNLAEACLHTTVSFLLRDAHHHGKIRLIDSDHPERGSGMIVLAMGKLGAYELNYSSDIDLIVFVDNRAPAIIEPFEAVEVFSKLVRRLVRILQERTATGYVFRVDLRLRPDPGSTPLALPVTAALRYYEERGQNWERAAMIKARPVAGDQEAGEKFLQELSPYIWRKYLDYAAIADIQSIKRQIHAFKGNNNLHIRGHNIKLGRGGIREIEFFVQTQQLIAGGRFPQLRGSGTLSMLNELCVLSWITREVRDNLEQNYLYLRQLEHRIQMIADEQTHIIPDDDDQLLRIAYMMGYYDVKDFNLDCLKILEGVEKHYAALFEQQEELGTITGNLVFTGKTDDPDTLNSLTMIGFQRPADISRTIRSWHYGRYPATRSAEARERLTELTPALLKAFGNTKNGDDAFMRFDSFLQGLPAGVQLFSLLKTNPILLELLVLIMSAAPRLAQTITRRPHIFDGLLDPSLYTELPTLSYLKNRLDQFLASAMSYEDILVRLRIFASEQKFLIGVRLLTGTIDGRRSGLAYTDLANLIIREVFEVCFREFALRHGVMAGCRVAVLGLGKIGTYELTASSDIDIILIYDHDDSAVKSDGEKSLYVSQYFSRLTQRLIAALSAPMGEGVLYEVDMRLRPSGNQGPIAVHLAAFQKYQRANAWTWEHLALTRARVICGDQNLTTLLQNEIATIVAKPRSRQQVAEDVRAMRAYRQRNSPKSFWDLKMTNGGIVDLEFIVQFAQLIQLIGFREGQPTIEALKKFPIAPITSNLVAASQLYTDTQQILRLCLDGVASDEELLPGLIEILLKATGEPDLPHLKATILEAASDVKASFDAFVC